MMLNVGCGPHYVEEAMNTDVIRVPGVIEPDIVVAPGDPFPSILGTFDRVYIGHVIEHLPWGDVPEFLRRLTLICEPDARVMIVGPDTDEVIRNYALGRSTWDDVQIAIEGAGAYTSATGFTAPRWDADRHWWNCTGDRVADLLKKLGWRSIVRYPVDEDGDLPALPGWPLVSQARNQFALSATIPA